MSLAEVWKPGVGMISPLGRADHALFDLVGKALSVPAWKLLGGRGPARFPVYDGSFYFADLLPEHASKGADRLVEEVDDSLAAGHRAMKVKVGRGFKWMEREAGFRRDIEVMHALRKRVGPGVKLMVDANNGFDPDGAMRWLDAVGDDLFFVEEMFPEQVESDLKLKDYLKKKGWSTRLADGESAGEVEHFGPYIAAGAMDVLQADVRAFGLTKLWELSRRAEARPGVALAPHNWGSYLGIYMIAVLGRGLANVLIGEQDRSSSDLFDASAFALKDGLMSVPDTPGCGLALREDVFAEEYRPKAWIVE
jgi:D-galactarolactone cycloisomerase